MIAALLLAAFAASVAVLGSRLLSRPWVLRSPRVAVLGWQALSASVVTSILLAATALALPFLPLRFSLASLLGAHTITIVEHYETPVGSWPGVLGLAVVAVLTTMLTTTTARGFVRTRRIRRSQRDALELVGRRHPGGFTVIEHDVPVAYCLPGTGTGTVVLSSAALALLNDREREMVLGHERRHLRARHDLALAFSGALARTFPWVPLFATAHAQIAVLLEMAADDAAASPADRRALAGAIVALGTGVRPEAALAASDTAALIRVRRLTSTTRSPVWGLGLAAGAGAALLLSLPLGLALAPAVEAAARDCCTVADLSTRS
jgi:Zn-dependent protease with chaperone function